MISLAKCLRQNLPQSYPDLIKKVILPVIEIAYDNKEDVQEEQNSNDVGVENENNTVQQITNNIFASRRFEEDSCEQNSSPKENFQISESKQNSSYVVDNADAKTDSNDEDEADKEEIISSTNISRTQENNTPEKRNRVVIKVDELEYHDWLFGEVISYSYYQSLQKQKQDQLNSEPNTTDNISGNQISDSQQEINGGQLIIENSEPELPVQSIEQKPELKPENRISILDPKIDDRSVSTDIIDLTQENMTSTRKKV